MSLYRTAPDLGTLHLKHFSLLLKFCTPHCHKKEIPAVKGGTAVAAIQEMCKKHDAKIPCYKASPHLHEVWGHCSASKLSGPESLALPERKRERGEGKREWLSMIIRPEMTEKGLISHEMRVRDERGTQKERELRRSWKKEDCRELQPSALGNWDGLRWYVVCGYPRTRCLLVNGVIPPPLRGNLFSVPHIHLHWHPFTHNKNRQYLILKDGRIKKKTRRNKNILQWFWLGIQYNVWKINMLNLRW